jgi:hypothetical protein
MGRQQPPGQHAAPGRMPGMNEPCSRRLFAISSGRNIRRFQKKQKKKISVPDSVTYTNPVVSWNIRSRWPRPNHWKTIPGITKITDAKMMGMTPAMFTFSGRK